MAVDRIEQIVLNDCNRIKTILEGTRDKIKAEIHTRSNLSGCLTGSVDDYLSVFDEQIDKMKKRMALSRS